MPEDICYKHDADLKNSVVVQSVNILLLHQATLKSVYKHLFGLFP